MIPELLSYQYRTGFEDVSTIFVRMQNFLSSLIVKEDRRRCLEFLNLMAAAPLLSRICNATAIDCNSKPTKGDDYGPHLRGSIAWTENVRRSAFGVRRARPGTGIPTAGLKKFWRF